MDIDKIKQFLVLHFEKFLVGLFAFIAVFLIYSGLQLPNFLDEEQPNDLNEKATQVKLAIDNDHNEEIIPARVPTFDILGQTKKLYTAVDSGSYKWEKTLESQNERSIVRRQDPNLLAPLDLRTHGVITTIAIKGSAALDDYPLAILEPADPLEKIERRRRPSPRNRRNQAMDEFGMDETMMMEAEAAMMTSPGMEVKPIRKFDSNYDFGARPTTGEDRRNPKPAVGLFIAGTALLPHREIYEAYELALKDADAYDPRRDTPVYFNFEVQRADVTDTPVDDLTDDDWIKVWNMKRYAELADGFWAGFAPEIVPDDYREDQLTPWIPPVLLDDYRPYSIHPKIPMISQSEMERMKAEEAAMAGPEITAFEFSADDEVKLAAPGIQNLGNGMMDNGFDDMEMMAGGMMMFSSGKIEKDPVEYKLMRFYDFSGASFFKNAPKVGRSYVYRLRYAVNDPNFPLSAIMQPKTSSLAPEVARRVLDKMADAKQAKERSFQRWSEWSAPSQPATLPTGEQILAGSVNPGSVSSLTVAGRSAEYQRDSPTAKIVVSQFDPAYGTKVAMEMEVTEGSVLSHKAEHADVVDPIKLEVKKMPDPKFVSNSIIVDLAGGRELKITDELTEPGMVLMFDQMGKLRLSDEIQDQELYRIKSFADEKEK